MAQRRAFTRGFSTLGRKFFRLGPGGKRQLFGSAIRAEIQVTGRAHKVWSHQQPGSSTATMAKWKVSGLPAEAGIAGVFAFLQTQKWTNIDIIFLADNQLIFLSGSLGNTEPMYCQFHGIYRQLKYKATNATARKMLKDANIVAQSSSASTNRAVNARAKDRKAFLDKVVPKAGVNAPASPRVTDPEKRNVQTGTGVTPDGKQRRA